MPFRRILAAPRPVATPPRARAADRPGFRLRRAGLAVEALEDRTVPSTFTVLNLADGGDGSLRGAVLAAEANPGPDLIQFAPQVRGTITLTSGELPVSTDLTIAGPGAGRLTVSGNGASRVFNVTGGADAGTAIAVGISGLTITRGRADDVGGGILNSGFSDLTLSGVVLSGNVAVGVTSPNANGGAVFSTGSGSSLTVIHSSVVGNTADGRDALRAIGGGLSVVEGRLSVVNSIIADNRALGGAAGVALGGGLRLSFATGTVSGSVVRGNRAVGGPDGGEAFGGGIGVRLSDLTLDGSTLIGNEARAGNGGVYGQAAGGAIDILGSVSITESQLIENRAVAGSGGANSGDDFSVGTAYGGAISNGGLLEISNAIIRDNEAVGGNNGTHADAPNTADVGTAHGGAIANIGGAELVIRDSMIAHNRAVGGHGNTGSGPVAFVGTATGGGIDNSLDLFLFGEPDHYPSRLAVINCTLRGNEAVGGDNNSGSGVHVFAGAGLGGGVANYLGALAEISGSALAGNRAVGGAGGLGAGGGIFNGIGEVPAAGGAVVVPTIVTVSGSTLERNVSQGGTGGDGLGGGAYNDATAEVYLEGSVVTRNKALGGENGGHGVGGGIYNLGVFDPDALTLIDGNSASTSHEDVFE